MFFVSKSTLILLCLAEFSFAKNLPLDKYVSESELGIYKQGAVVTNGWECAQIGADILKKNGSAVDAAIATHICESVASFQSMGFGGGFLMTIYNATTKTTEFLNAREMAPAATRANMFHDDPKLSLKGGLAIALPGQLMGFWEAHQKYGKLPWKDLFEPAIRLCEHGSNITWKNYKDLKRVEKDIIAEPSLSELLINPETNELYQVGHLLKRPKLAETMKRLANHPNPPKLFYEGDIADTLVKDIQSYNGIVTKEDFANYRVKWSKPLEAKVGNLTLYTSPPPGSGSLVIFMLRVLKDLVKVENESILWQRIVETFKWGYARRTELGDSDIVKDVDRVIKKLLSEKYADKIRNLIEDNKTYKDPQHYEAFGVPQEDHGTGNVCVMAPDGSAVSVTATINQIMGATIRSRSTGIIFNDQMDDFSSPHKPNGYGLPPAPNNYIAPGKRPMSTISPTIIVDENGEVRLIVGAAGGSRIATSVTGVILFHLYKNYTIKEAIDMRRLHHQLFPMKLSYEDDFSPVVLKYLDSVGHNLTDKIIMTAAVTAISKENGLIMATGDPRWFCQQAGF